MYRSEASRWVVPAVVALSLLAWAGAGPAGAQLVFPLPDYSDPSNLFFTIQTDKPTYAMGEIVKSHVTVTNTGTQPFVKTYQHSNPRYGGFGAVNGEDYSAHNRGYSPAFSTLSIAPGQTIQWDSQWKINHWQSEDLLLPPGQYYAYGGIDGVGRISVPFTVTPPTPATQGPPNTRTVMSIVDGLEYAIQLDQRIYLPGQPVHVFMRARNVGNRSFDWGDMMWEAKFLETGFFAPSSFVASRKETMPFKLSPGEMIEWQTTWDMSTQYPGCLALPGKYEVAGDIAFSRDLLLPFWIAIPEPSTGLLAMVGVALLGLRRR